MEGGLKQKLSIIPFLNQIHSDNPKSFIEQLLASFKDGLTVFVALLLLLSFLEYVMGIIQGKPTTILDKLDIVTAFVGFVLMFVGKFLERLYGKN